MNLLDLWIAEALQSGPRDVVEMDLPETVSTPAEKAVVRPVDARELEAAQRELQALLEQPFLLADGTNRLRKLAVMLGLQAHVKRHHFWRDDPEMIVLP